MNPELQGCLKELDKAIENLIVTFLKDFFSKDYEILFENSTILKRQVLFTPQNGHMSVMLNFGNVYDLFESEQVDDERNLFCILVQNYFLCIECGDNTEVFVTLRNNFETDLVCCYILELSEILKNGLMEPIIELLRKVDKR